MPARPTLLFSGMVGAAPWRGGATWAVLQYLIGFRELGWDVWFVEPAGASAADYVRCVMTRFGFDGRWALVDGDGSTTGTTRDELLAAARRAELLVNVSGGLTDAALLDPVPVRAYLDLDPAFVQLWHTAEGVDMRLDAHTHFVTLSDAVGRTIPDCGRTWLPILPPVVLSHWPFADVLEHRALTTVAHWRGYGSISHDNVHYGQKAHSLRPLFALPGHVPVALLLALDIHPGETDDLEALTANGWGLLDPAEMTATPDAYHGFVAGSLGEFGVAKSGYVVSDSGWFSDRSACYLASGRPVIAQETGFSRFLPTGQGLFAFESQEDVVAASQELRSDYERHGDAARAIAEEHFDSDRVLTRLLERVGA